MLDTLLKLCYNKGVIKMKNKINIENKELFISVINNYLDLIYGIKEKMDEAVSLQKETGEIVIPEDDKLKKFFESTIETSGIYEDIRKKLIEEKELDLSELLLVKNVLIFIKEQWIKQNKKLKEAIDLIEDFLNKFENLNS